MLGAEAIEQRLHRRVRPLATATGKPIVDLAHSAGSIVPERLQHSSSVPEMLGRLAVIALLLRANPDPLHHVGGRFYYAP